MIQYGYSEFAENGGVHYWVPDHNQLVMIEELPKKVQTVIRWSGYYAVDGTLAICNAYNSRFLHDRPPLHQRNYDLLRDGLDPVMTNHLSRALHEGHTESIGRINGL